MDDSNESPPTANENEKTQAGPTESRLETSDMFEALTNERRRYLLYTLFEDDTWSLDELATKLAAWENRVPVEEVTSEEVEKVYASLYHAHVPKLVDYEILEFDEQTETIAGGPSAKSALDVLELTGASDSAQMETHARSNDNDS